MCQAQDSFPILCISEAELQTIAFAHNQQLLTKKQIEEVIQKLQNRCHMQSFLQQEIRNCVEEATLKTAYDEWLTAVDEWLWTNKAMYILDLADYDFYSLFVNGEQPKEAAKIAVQEVFHVQL